MKASFGMFSLILASVALLGCSTSGSKDRPTRALSEREQKAALAHCKSPAHFGFSVVPAYKGIDFRGAARLKSTHPVVAKLLKGTIPVIEVRGENPRDTIKMLVDFSAPVSWMEYLTAKRQKVAFLGVNNQVIPYRGAYYADGINAYAGAVEKVWIDSLSMENVPFYIRMSKGTLGPLARGIIDPPVEATLGYDNLRNFKYVQIDMLRNQMVFSAATSYQPSEELLIATAKIIHLSGYGLVVEGAILGQAVPLVIDFAGDYSFARGDVAVESTKQISLGEMVFRQVPTLALNSKNAAPRVGRKIFEPYIVTVCNEKGVVYFERPAK